MRDQKKLINMASFSIFEAQEIDRLAPSPERHLWIMVLERALRDLDREETTVTGWFLSTLPATKEPGGFQWILATLGMESYKENIMKKVKAAQMRALEKRKTETYEERVARLSTTRYKV